MISLKIRLITSITSECMYSGPDFVTRILTGWLSYASSVVMLLSYGVLPSGPDDPDIQAIDECMSYFGKNLRPGYWMVDYWPFLRHEDPSHFSFIQLIVYS